MPQIATVGHAGGFRDDGAIGTQEEPAVFRRNTITLRVLREIDITLTEQFNHRERREPKEKQAVGQPGTALGG